MLFRQARIRDAIPYFEKAARLQNSDFTNPLMLMTCYTAIHDEEGSRRAANSRSSGWNAPLPMTRRSEQR